MGYEWDFHTVLRHWPELLAGGANTLKLVASALLIAVPVGLLLGVIRQQKIRLLRYFAVAYIEFFRSTVALVLIYWCYYALPVLLNISLDTFAAVTLALGLQASAFMAELVRGSMDAIGAGQWQAAKALGLGRYHTLRYVILPQSARLLVPVFFLLIVDVIKNTALAGVVTYGELFYSAVNIASNTYRALETFTLLGLIYFVTIFAASHLADYYQRHVTPHRATQQKRAY